MGKDLLSIARHRGEKAALTRFFCFFSPAVLPHCSWACRELFPQGCAFNRVKIYILLALLLPTCAHRTEIILSLESCNIDISNLSEQVQRGHFLACNAFPCWKSEKLLHLLTASLFLQHMDTTQRAGVKNPIWKVLRKLRDGWCQWERWLMAAW